MAYVLGLVLMLAATVVVADDKELLQRMELEIKIDRLSDEAFSVANARVKKVLEQTSLYKELQKHGDYPVEELYGHIQATEDVLRQMGLTEDKLPSLKLLRRLQRLREQFVIEAWREEFGKRLKSLKIKLSPKRRRALEKRHKLAI